jgi:bacterioferritin-associated ferredoxin
MISDKEKNKVQHTINIGFDNMGDVFLLISHVGNCEACKNKFQEIITHSKQHTQIIDTSTQYTKCIGGDTV